MGARAVPLGPFDLFEVVGRGGMGVVRRAVHRESGTAVAVKLMTAKGSTDPRFVAAFQDEARAFAALSHPAIVAVHDFGEVPLDAPDTDDERPVGGTPYLVMELVEGGTLAPLRGRLDWATLRSARLTLLGALAHAHARGIVHRDLKPANVLVDGGLPSVKLTDFGLAHVARGRADGPVLSVSGTPSTMAPEQFQGRWRDFGPWTDLYALGATAWTLAAGHPPFRGDYASAARSHVSERLPRLEAVTPVPIGFEGWLRALLAKDPEARFQRAADAAEALRELGAPVRGGTSAPEATADADTVLLPDWSPTVAPVGAPVAPAPAVRAPFPPDWGPTETGLRAALGGTGMGVFGLRTLPLADRYEARDALWQALGAVRADRSARAVVLRGPAGFGKTRLAAWLGERAHEVGAASPWRVVHGPNGGPHEGLGAMVAHELRLAGLPAGAATGRVRRWLAQRGDPAGTDADAVVALALAGSAEAPPIRFDGPRERHALLERLAACAAAERPLVLVLDDAQWGHDALLFALHLLAAQVRAPLPALLLLTVRDEALAERPAERALLDVLLARPDVSAIDVGPLPGPETAALVRGLLGLDPDLAARVEARIAGNPQFAVSLVADWLERHLLEPGPRGVRLRSGEGVDLPADVHATWADRIERLLRRRPAADGVALEVAAVLGREVDAEEWALATAALGAPPSDGLVREVLRQGLARAEDPTVRWAFGHEMLRETLVRRAAVAGRAPAAHRACADVLLGRISREGSAARAGRHLACAGEHDRAVEALVRGARDAMRLGSPHEAVRLATEAEDALRAARVAPSDARWGRCWIARGYPQQVLGAEFALGEDLARCVGEAEHHGWDDVLAEALLLRAVAATRHRRLDDGAELYARSAEVAARAGLKGLYAKAKAGCGTVDTYRARTDDALRHLREAEAALGPDDPSGADGTVRLSLGALLVQRRDAEGAERAFGLAQAAFERAGYRVGLAVASAGLAHVALVRGELDEALRIVERCVVVADAVGGAFAAAHRLELAHVRICRGEYAVALAVADGVIGELRSLGASASTFLARPYRLPGLAQAGAWDEFDRALADVRERVLGTSWGGGASIGEAADAAARLAAASGETERAGRAAALARAVWTRLGRSDRAAALAAVVRE